MCVDQREPCGLRGICRRVNGSGSTKNPRLGGWREASAVLSTVVEDTRLAPSTHVRGLTGMIPSLGPQGFHICDIYKDTYTNTHLKI